MDISASYTKVELLEQGENTQEFSRKRASAAIMRRRRGGGDRPEIRTRTDGFDFKGW